MLGLDLDMEADLGIDSIKRVEILGSLQEEIGGSCQGEGEEAEKEMGEFGGIKTIKSPTKNDIKKLIGLFTAADVVEEVWSNSAFAKA